MTAGYPKVNCRIATEVMRERHSRSSTSRGATATTAPQSALNRWRPVVEVDHACDSIIGLMLIEGARRAAHQLSRFDSGIGQVGYGGVSCLEGELSRAR